MGTVVVSTCGTSLLTNQFEHTIDPSINAILRAKSNLKEHELTADQKCLIDLHVKEKQKKLSEASTEEQRKFSAEINGLMGFYDKNYNVRHKDLHFLIHSHTYQGQVSAELLGEWCENRSIPVIVHQIESLNTQSVDDFHAGILSLIEWCTSTLPCYKESGWWF